MHIDNKYQGRNVRLLRAEPDSCIEEGEEILDIIKSTCVVEWTTETVHPKAGEKKSDASYGYVNTYPDIIRETRRAPHEVALLVVAKSKDDTVASLSSTLASLREDVFKLKEDLRVTSADLGKAQDERAKLATENDNLKARVREEVEIRTATANAHEESRRLIRELQAKLALIEKRVGSVQFAELTK